MLLWPEEHILFASQDAVSEFLVLRDLNVELQEKNTNSLYLAVFSQICKKPISN